MGITCKATGKMRGILRKIDNENEVLKAASKNKKEDKKNEKKD